MITSENIARVNHVQKLAKRAGLNRAQFIREVLYRLHFSRGTAEKVFDGATDLDLSVVEKLALFFEVGKDDVLESKLIS